MAGEQCLRLVNALGNAIRILRETIRVVIES